MATVSGAAIFKKKNGLLSIYETADPPMLKWIAADQSVAIPRLDIPLRSITNLQASPATSDKLLIRLVHTLEGEAEPSKTVFSFTNKMIMETIKDSLRLIVERQEMSKETTKQSQSLQIQLTQSKDNLEEILDPKKLLDNLELQQRLLNSEPGLKQVFTETVIRNKLDPQEFWKTRLHLLGTFALKSKAKKGPYNVLSTISLVASSYNSVELNVTREKIHAIFDQYPIVRKAYEDNVPRIPEGDFWSRFFASKLFRKLRGEKPNKNEKGDLILDTYLKVTDEELALMDEEDKNAKLAERGEDDVNIDDIVINRFYNVEGNEDDNSQKLGNQPDFTMRPDKDKDMISIMRGYNRLSKKLVANVEDEENYIKAKRRKISPAAELEEEIKEKTEELRFEDLGQSNDAEFVELHVNNFKSVQINDKSSTVGDAEVAMVVDKMKNYFPEGSIDLKSVYQEKQSIDLVNKEILSNLIKNAKQSKQNWQVAQTMERDFIGSTIADPTTASMSAVENIMSAIGSSTQVDQVSSDKLKIPGPSVENLRLVHITSEEFLKHFWLHFNSGDPAQVNTTKRLYNSIKKCVKRVYAAIKTVKDSAPPEKATEHEEYAKTLLLPVIKSLIKAKKEYELAEANAKE
ncbi:TFIIH/NER complex subunit [Saccharomycopsis crataegensis]|uniref:TFIIH/NER complex subunit n=1 Tax=Saccharomycopsis crataegensis TaxID=43959 RepID=A0AAV5QME6_9ASCO|nr:TFIIH/NER complex subunit [Saccharomycopsis crataegensis]